MRILTIGNEVTYVNFGYDDYTSLIKDAKRNIIVSKAELYNAKINAKVN